MRIGLSVTVSFEISTAAVGAIEKKSLNLGQHLTAY